MKKTTKKTSAIMINVSKTPQVVRNRDYTGAPVEANRLYIRTMSEFKNTKASVMVAVNDVAGTVTYLNLYRDGHLPASFDPAIYTYPITPKLAKKLDGDFREIEDRDEWPEFIKSAARRKVKTTK